MKERHPERVSTRAGWLFRTRHETNVATQVQEREPEKPPRYHSLAGHDRLPAEELTFGDVRIRRDQHVRHAGLGQRDEKVFTTVGELALVNNARRPHSSGQDARMRFSCRPTRAEAQSMPSTFGVRIPSAARLCQSPSPREESA